MKYTQPQSEAIEKFGEDNLLILACAGSGKTEVISRGVAKLISEGVPRKSIIAFTFMEKAAESLKNRIRKHLEDLSPSYPMLGELRVGTIHGISFNILKNLDPIYRKYEVMDDQRQSAFVSSNYFSLGLKGLDGSFRSTLNTFLNTLNAMYIKNIDLDEIEDENLKNSIRRYYELSRNEPYHLLDFNSILDELIKFLKENPDKLQEIRNELEYLVVDEYQDVDPRQEELIELLTNKGKEVKLCVVGDDDQSIYGWRGANVSNILTFEDRYPDVQTVRIPDNFRSTIAIVDVANSAIEQLGVGNRHEKKMNGVHRDKDTDELVGTLPDQGDCHKLTFSSKEEEASYIADRIEELYGVEIEEEDGKRGMCYGDVAVLFRAFNNKRLSDLTDELDRRGIEYIMRGSDQLFNNKEIKIAQAVFTILADKEFHYVDENDDYIRLEGEQIFEYIEEKINELKDNGYLENLESTNSFLDWIVRKKRAIDDKTLISLQRIFHEMLSAMGADKGEETLDESLLYNFGQFSNLLSDFETVHRTIGENELKKLIYYMGSWASVNTPNPDTNKSTVADAVNIQTIHKAKGLEWPVVFIPQINGRHFPSPNRNRVLNTYLEDEDFDLSSFADGMAGERRLWYVSMTRCKKFLELTSIDTRGERPSDFFNDVNHPFFLETDEDPTDRDYTEPSLEENEILNTSYSDLRYYWLCPYDYKLRHVMDFSPEIVPALGYGNEVHRFLYSIHEKAMKGEEITEEWVNEEIKSNFSLRYATEQIEKNMKKAASKTLRRYVKEFPNLTQTTLDAEKEFEIMIGNSRVNGAIDLLEKLDESGETSPIGVIDFKLYDEESDLDKRIESVKNQLRIYALAARDAFQLDPKKASAYFLSDDGCKTIGIDVTDDQKDNIKNNVSDTVDDIISENFPRSPEEEHDCSKCDFKNICPGPER